MTPRRGARRLLLAVLMLIATGACTTVAFAAMARSSGSAPSKHRAGCRARAHHHCCRAAHSHRRITCQRHRKAAHPTPGGSTLGTGPVSSGATGVSTSAGGSSSGSAPAGASGTATTPAEESPHQAAGPAHVQVTAEDAEAFRFILSRPSVPAGEVIIEFVNHGQDEHNLHAAEAPGGGEVGSLPNAQPNSHPTLKVDLRPGSYTLFCSLPGHEAKGMKATLTVE
jgi:plastocyanin